MRFLVVSSDEYTYPDIEAYQSAANAISLVTDRNSFATAQVLLFDVPGDGNLEAACEGMDAELYSLMAIPVEAPTEDKLQQLKSKFRLFKDYYHMDAERRRPHVPERDAPFMVFDCVKPYDGHVDLYQGVGGFYVSVPIPADAKPGFMTGRLIIKARGESAAIDIRIHVLPAVIPGETVTVVNGYRQHIVCRYHGVEMDSPAFEALDTKYLRMLRRGRQNMLYTPGVKVEKTGENEWSFDFSRIERFVEKALKEGFTSFFGPSVGWRKSWEESTILFNGSIPAMSYEGYCYLAQYLSALREFLIRRGWAEQFRLGVADEPNDANCTEYRALCGLIRRFIPEVKLMDAMSYGDLHGSLDVYIPLNSEFDKHQKEYESFRQHGDELWHYVCCKPRGEGYVNRFMDYPLLSSQYIFWGNYRYNLTGYLHWAANFYQPGQNPFKESCPEHHNTNHVCILPPGDTHIIYPGTDGPWMSMRLEAQREGLEACELLRLIAQKDKAKADAVCAKVFRSFRDVEWDVRKYLAVRSELLETASSL